MLRLLAMLLLFAGPAMAADKVAFGLDWKAEAEYGGYDQAVATGIYAQRSCSPIPARATIDAAAYLARRVIALSRRPTGCSARCPGPGSASTPEQARSELGRCAGTLDARRARCQRGRQ